jgi:hypothetical protein
MITPPPDRITGNWLSPAGAPRIERLGAAGAALDFLRRHDFVIAFAVIVIARNVELHRAALVHRDSESPVHEFRHAQRRIHVHLVFGDLREDRHLLGFLEAAQPHREAAGFGRDAHHRRMRPVRGGDAGHEIGDAGAVLCDAHAVPAGDARIAVGHVRGVLLVRDGNETDACERKQIVSVHVGRADDAERVLHALRHQRFDERFGRRHAHLAESSMLLSSVIVVMIFPSIIGRPEQATGSRAV